MYMLHTAFLNDTEHAQQTRACSAATKRAAGADGRRQTVPSAFVNIRWIQVDFGPTGLVFDVQGLAGEFYWSTGTYRAVYHKPLHVSSQCEIDIFLYRKIDNFIKVSVPSQ